MQTKQQILARLVYQETQGQPLRENDKARVENFADRIWEAAQADLRQKVFVAMNASPFATLPELWAEPQPTGTATPTNKAAAQAAAGEEYDPAKPE